jgi:hypothetical protein
MAYADPMWFPAPPMPAFAPGHATTTERHPRYEDFTQDGRLTTIAIPPALATLWQTVLADHAGARAAMAAGVIPLLTRLTLTSLDRPVEIHRPIEATVGFELAHDRDLAGEPARLFLNVWADVRGVAASGADRAWVLAGQAFAEHTFTRPFAPAGARRVTSLAGIAGYPALPEARYAAPAPASAAALPAGATWLDALAPDAVDTVFTLDHSDANQHVNSLVYLRCFLDAVQRRLAAGGHPAKLRCKAIDIAYRKPCFVGDRVRAHVRLFAHGDQLGGAGVIAAPGEEARPRCYVRAVFGP